MNSIIYQFLNEPRRLRRKLEEVNSKIEDLRATMLPGAIRYDKDSVMCSPEDNMVEYAIRFEPLAKERDMTMREYERAYAEIMDALEHLTYKQKTVILMKYLDGLSNTQISQKLGIDKRNVLRLCDRAYETLLDDMLTATSRIKYNAI